MFNDPYHWFPNLVFSNLLAVLFFGSFLIDYIIPKVTAPRSGRQVGKEQDRSSFMMIQAAGLIGVLAAFLCRYGSLTVLPAWVQWLGLALGALGIAFREWAVITLGKFFSRVVEIEAGHRLITTGPYRWLRHPAYTGMILFYLGLGLAIGSGLGALICAGLISAATLYRIKVEEAALAQAFGEQYQVYARRRWKLFPGW